MTDAMFWMWLDYGSVRTNRWKQHYSESKNRVELYDLKADISEKNNLADKYPEIVKRLTSMMEEFDRELKANVRPAGKV